MYRLYRRLFMVMSSLALVTTTVATIAPPATATTIADQPGQRKALYQSELEQNLLLRTQLGYGLIAAYGPLRVPPGWGVLSPNRVDASAVVVPPR